MSRRALSRCEIPGDKIEGKEELEGNGKEMKLISFLLLFLPVSPTQLLRTEKQKFPKILILSRNLNFYH